MRQLGFPADSRGHLAAPFDRTLDSTVRLYDEQAKPNGTVPRPDLTNDPPRRRLPIAILGSRTPSPSPQAIPELTAAGEPGRCDGAEDRQDAGAPEKTEQYQVGGGMADAGHVGPTQHQAANGVDEHGDRLIRGEPVQPAGH